MPTDAEIRDAEECRLVHLRLMAEKDREIERLKKIVDGITAERIKNIIWDSADKYKQDYDSNYSLSCSNYMKTAEAIVKELRGEL